MYQVMIVDDEQLIINSLALGFDWKEHGYEIAATCTNSTEALKLIEFIHPDVVFCDIKMPSLSGLELMERVHESLPQIQFVFISGYADFKYTQRAIRLGASGYCLKPLENEEIEEALISVTKRLEERGLVIRSSFELLTQRPSPASARALLDLVYAGKELPQSLTVLLSIGDAAPLLSGHVCYFSVKAGENCSLYFISSNGEYLSSVLFQTALLRSVSDGEIKAMSWQDTEDPVAFLSRDLLTLFDDVYSYFVRLPAALGPVKAREEKGGSASNDEYLKNVSVLANKGRIMDVLEAVTRMKEKCPGLKPSEAVVLYNTCGSMIARTKNAEWTFYIRYPHELANKFAYVEDMLLELQRKMEALAGSANPENVSNDTFRRILEYINHNFTSSISFQELSGRYGINASYLSQLFKKELGITFTRYLANLRIQYAKELLETTTMRINEIPEKIGYGYDYNFAKLFKKETGYSPREYRELKKRK